MINNRSLLWISLFSLATLIFAIQCTSPLVSSPGSKSITKRHLGLVYYSKRENSKGLITGGLYLMDLETKQEKLLTSANDLSEYDTFDWSPVTQKLVYSAYDDTGKDKELYLTDLEGNIVRLTDNDAEDVTGSWMPNDEKIIFSSNREDKQSFHVYFIDFDGSNIQPVFENESIISGEYAWSPDSKKLAIGTVALSLDPPAPPEEGLRILDIETKKVLLYLSDDHVRSNFNWSYDSNKLVYLSDLTATENVGLYKKMYILDTETKQETLIADFEIIGNPRWSPVKDMIAFSASTLEEMNNQEMNVYLVDSKGQELDRLTDKGFYRVDSWDPSGSKLAITFIGKGAAENEIYTFDIENKMLERITDNNAFETSPMWVELE